MIGVVGGGVGGSAAALALRQLGLEVVVWEASDLGRARVGETLPPDARTVLGALGVGDSFDREAHAACHGSASCWADPSLGFNDHFVHAVGQGWHLDRARFDRWLSEQAEQAGAEVRRGARVRGVTRSGGGWRVHLDGDECAVDAIIDATGSRSAIGRSLGSTRLFHDRLVYLAVEVPAPDGAPISGQTLLEATELGWWYAAQLPSGTWTIAVATDPDLVKTHALHTAAGWRAALARTLHLRHRVPVVDGQFPVAWTATSSLLGPPAGPGWIAVGDAAMSWDPICARGIYKALHDGLRAGQTLRRHLDGDPDAIGEHARYGILAFRGYLEQRAALYDQVRRWPASTFWTRRQARRNLRAPRTREAGLTLVSSTSSSTAAPSGPSSTNSPPRTAGPS